MQSGGLCQQKQILMQVPRGAPTHGRAHTPSPSHARAVTLRHTLSLPIALALSLESSTTKTVSPIKTLILHPAQ